MGRAKRNRNEREDELATLEEARRATISARDLKGVRDFWPGFAAAADAGPGKRAAGARIRPGWRWALGTAGLMAVLGIVILVPTLSRRGSLPPAPAEAPLAFRVDSVAYEEKPAQAFVFHTEDPDTTYVWVDQLL